MAQQTQQNTMIVTILIAIIALGVGFFGGMKYQESKNPGGGQYQGFNRNGGMMRNGVNGQRRMMQGGQPVVGEIVSIDDKSMVVKLPDGSTKIVNISGTTTISKTDTGSKTDLKQGTRVAAFGTTNSDGSVTAQNVQINPMFRTRGGAQQPTPTK